MLTEEQVYEMISKEIEYGAGWAKGTRKISKVEGVDDSDVHALAPLDGTPFSISDFKDYAKKYWDESTLALSNFTPDGAAVRIRILKVIALLVRALKVHGRASDLERIAGVSSSEFPIMSGGLKTFKESSSEEGCLIPTADTKRLRNEAPSCDPLK